MAIVTKFERDYHECVNDGDAIGIIESRRAEIKRLEKELGRCNGYGNRSANIKDELRRRRSELEVIENLF